jgi:tRNA-dihydrouridine synthase B
VTLKIRTGWDKDQPQRPEHPEDRRAVGIRALAMHGRTRACGYSGQAEYDTIRSVKAEASIPVIANGDIGSPEKAKQFSTSPVPTRDDRPRGTGASLAVP